MNNGPHPNVVLVLTDDMGYSDLGCYGGEIETPNLDALAADGLRFTQFYNAGRCCPTRASLLTGLYAHQAGVGWMTDDYGHESYRGDLSPRAVTIAEALRPAGYRTYLSGKWHVCRDAGPDGPKGSWPLRRGFDRFYGTITGAGSYYDPTTLCRGETFITPENDPEYRPERFYYTDAITDNAVRFLADHERDHAGSPFFLYVAYTAAHWPMHALPEDVAKYAGRYDAGYATTRAARLEKARRLGVVDERWDLTPPDDDWDAVEHKAWEARNMEVYAAMVDRMDRGVGRIAAELKRQGAFENTLVLFLQDNGGCAENLGRRSNADTIRDVSYAPLGPDGLQPKIWPPMQTRDGRPVRTGPGVMAGPGDTYIAYGRGWANVSNTPFRRYKHWQHEGGISTPLIAHWPAGMAAGRGTLNHEPAHLIDVLATCVDLGDAEYPSARDGNPVPPPEGVSLRPAFEGSGLGRPTPIFWEHEGHRAVRDGHWKLVAEQTGEDPGAWELYDMEADRSEMHDLSAAHPERVREMAAQYDAWAERVGVQPWPLKRPGETPSAG